MLVSKSLLLLSFLVNEALGRAVAGLALFLLLKKYQRVAREARSLSVFFLILLFHYLQCCSLLF